jgi:hypothetical protein
MERSLYQNDSDFVARVTKRQGRPTYTSITLGVLGALAGVAVIILGLVIRQPLIGVVGFVLMLAGVLFALRPGFQAARSGGAPKRSTGPGASGKNGGSFMDRMNDRWDKRSQDR